MTHPIPWWERQDVEGDAACMGSSKPGILMGADYATHIQVAMVELPEEELDEELRDQGENPEPSSGSRNGLPC